MKMFLALAAVAVIAIPARAASPVPASSGVEPCRFTRVNPIPEQSNWTDQFKCYQASGRHVSVVGSGTFEAGTVSGGVCIVGVARDRVHLAPCGSFSGDWAVVLPYDAIAYVVDDARAENVNIYVAALFHR